MVCRSLNTGESEKVSLSTPEIIIVEDLKGLSRKAADLFVEQAAVVLKTRPFFSMALSGGATPESLYSLFASDPGIKDKIAWERVHIFWGDERHVPPDHPQSNFRMANRTMLAELPLPPQNIHRVAFAPTFRPQCGHGNGCPVR